MAETENTKLSETTRRLAYFEATTEKEKARLSRALHDELGGLLVAAAMDTSWAEQHLVDNPSGRDRRRYPVKAATDRRIAADPTRKLRADRRVAVVSRTKLRARQSEVYGR